MLTAELLGTMIGWLLAAIVMSLLLWMLVLIWGHLIQAMKAWFAVSSQPVRQPSDQDQVPLYPPIPHDGYSRRDFQ